MKILVYITILFALLSSCNSGTNETSENVLLNNKDSVKSPVISEVIMNPIYDSNNCNFEYDTITNRKYSMHLQILSKYYDKSKRGYIFTQEGDTVNEFLYYQDIVAFVGGLDSNETADYYLLTNRVVNLIIAKDPAVLDYGLPSSNRKNFDYFISHVGHQLCGKFEFDTVIHSIETKMKTPTEKAKKNKEILLKKIAIEKKRNANTSYI